MLKLDFTQKGLAPPKKRLSDKNKHENNDLKRECKNDNKPPASESTLVEQVVSGIAGLIESRQLPVGRKLPSIRAFATANGISKSTVVEAFDRLVAQGLLISRHKVGFFVAGPRPVLDLTANTPPAKRDTDPMWVLRNTLMPQHGGLQPGCGWLPEDWLNGAGLRRALRAVARSPSAQLTRYGHSLGFAPLRAQLQIVLAGRGVEVPPGRIIITDSTTQAIDMIGRLLLQPGDKVFVDDPGYYNFLASLRVHNVQVIGVPFRQDGPDTESFASLAAKHKPRLYLTNATLHNPTGATLAPAVAHRLLKIAEAHDIAIVEDDIYADFEEHPTPRLAAMDQLNRVIYTGSFSKTLSAASRCGWIAARQEWIEGLTDLRLATIVSNNELAAQVLHRLLTDGNYRKHVEGLRDRLRAASVRVRRQLEARGLSLWTEPKGGMFLWAKLPEGFDSLEIARRAVADGIALAPGNVFSVSYSATRFLRFNVTQSDNKRLYDFFSDVLRH
ncbi:MAG: PLP-dependent aminotransferase family protein [Alphaproteobacteria bacterium]